MSDFTEVRAVKAFWRADFANARKMILSCSEENIAFSEIIKIIHYNYQSFSPKEEIKDYRSNHQLIPCMQTSLD